MLNAIASDELTQHLLDDEGRGDFNKLTLQLDRQIQTICNAA